jgi:hypothetical protein
MKTFLPTFQQHEHEGSTYQPALRQWLNAMRGMMTLVETGSGGSTCFMAQALEERCGPGHIFSIDPAPWCGYSVDHPRVTNIRQKSREAMVDLYAAVHPWDFFLHDGNHDLYSQSYDIWMGYACLRPGGWIWCDDYTWGEHHAWKRWAAKNKLPLHDFGAASAVQKPPTVSAIPIEQIEVFSRSCLEKANEEAEAWRAAGHPDSAVFVGQA